MSVTCNRSVVFPGTPVASTIKTDATEILLKVALNTINHKPSCRTSRSGYPLKPYIKISSYTFFSIIRFQLIDDLFVLVSQEDHCFLHMLITNWYLICWRYQSLFCNYTAHVYVIIQHCDSVWVLGGFFWWTWICVVYICLQIELLKGRGLGFHHPV